MRAVVGEELHVAAGAIQESARLPVHVPLRQTGCPWLWGMRCLSLPFAAGSGCIKPAGVAGVPQHLRLAHRVRAAVTSQHQGRFAVVFPAGDRPCLAEKGCAGHCCSCEWIWVTSVGLPGCFEEAPFSFVLRPEQSLAGAAITPD